MKRNNGRSAVSTQLADVGPHSQAVFLGRIEDFFRVLRGKSAAVRENIHKLRQPSLGHERDHLLTNHLDIFLRLAAEIL